MPISWNPHYYQYSWLWGAYPIAIQLAGIAGIGALVEV